MTARRRRLSRWFQFFHRYFSDTMPLREAPRHIAKIFSSENLEDNPESRSSLQRAWGQSKIGFSLLGFNACPPKNEQAEARSTQRRILGQGSGGSMKIVVNIAGVLLLLIGTGWV